MNQIDSLPELSTPADVAELAREVFAAESRDAGVIHPAAVWRDGERLRSLVIGPDSPKSFLDAFSLNLARARADALITTGQILRSEPALTHELQGPHEMARALARWRKTHLEKSASPISLVLTSGEDLDLDHPLFETTDRAIIFTTGAGHRNLGGAAAEQGIEVVAHEDLGIRSAVRFLLRRGAKTISVEAGPSTSRELYQAPILVDEVFLSVFGAASLPESMQGGDLPPLQQLAAQFPGLSGYSQGEGDWSFYRFFR